MISNAIPKFSNNAREALDRASIRIAIAREPALPKFGIDLLGFPVVRIGDDPIGPNQWQRTDAKRLFFALVLNASHRLSREQLFRMLWPNLDKVGARTKLTNTLYSLRRAFGAGSDRIVSNADAIELTWGTDVFFDVEQFERHLITGNLNIKGITKQVELKAALEIYRGELLQGHPTEPWFEQDRALLAARHLYALDELVALRISHGHLHEAIESQRTRIGAEPTQQDAHACLLKLLLDTAQIDAALTHYKACRDLIASELGQAPSAEIEAIYVQIKAQTSIASATSSASSARQKSLTSIVPNKTAIMQTAPPIGRERDTDHLLTLLHEARTEASFVTIIGLGGVGKTTLARHLMSRWTKDSLAGPVPSVSQIGARTARFVDVSGLTSIEDAAELVRLALSLPLSLTNTQASPPSGDGHERVRGLLVIDNYEHLVNRRPILDTLCRRCPGLAVLVTSRLPLRLPEETAYSLSPLDVKTDAVALFVKRAKRHNPQLKFDSNDLTAAASICVAIDGLPLAIELAAARTRLFNLTELSLRLQHDLKILHAKPDGQTSNSTNSLWSILQWTASLLSVQAHMLLMYLSAFHGGFTLDAAEAVFPKDDVDVEVADLFEELMDHQLIVIAQNDYPFPDAKNLGAKVNSTERRWTLLETVRRYINDVVAQHSLVETVRTAHAEYHLKKAASLWSRDANSNQTNLFFANEVHNILVALDREFRIDPHRAAPQIVNALTKLRFNGHRYITTRWIQRLQSVKAEALTTDERTQLDVLTLSTHDSRSKNSDVADSMRRLVDLVETSARLNSTLREAVVKITTRMAEKGHAWEALEFVDGIFFRAQKNGALTEDLAGLRVAQYRLETAVGRWSNQISPNADDQKTDPDSADVRTRYALAFRQTLRGDFDASLKTVLDLRKSALWRSHQLFATSLAVVLAAHALYSELGLDLLDDLHRCHERHRAFDLTFNRTSELMCLTVAFFEPQSVDERMAGAMHQLYLSLSGETSLAIDRSAYFWYLRASASAQFSHCLHTAFAALLEEGIVYTYAICTLASELIGIVATFLQEKEVATDFFLLSQEARRRIDGVLSPREIRDRVKHNLPIQILGDDERYRAMPLGALSGHGYWARVKPSVMLLRDKADDLYRRPGQLLA